MTGRLKRRIDFFTFSRNHHFYGDERQSEGPRIGPPIWTGTRGAARRSRARRYRSGRGPAPGAHARRLRAAGRRSAGWNAGRRAGRFPSMLAVADVLPVMVAYIDATSATASSTGRSPNGSAAAPRCSGRHHARGHRARHFAAREPMLKAALAGERKFFASEFEHPERGALAVQTDYVPWAERRAGARDHILVQDVTEQRSAERALRESEARFRRIANSAPAMMWVTRLDRVRDFVNDAYVEFAAAAATAKRRGPSTGAPASTRRCRAHRRRERRRRGDAEALRARGPLPPPRRRMALAAERLPAALRADGELAGFIGVATTSPWPRRPSSSSAARSRRHRRAGEQRSPIPGDLRHVLEVLVLIKPDGTIVEMNQTRATWRDPYPRRRSARRSGTRRRSRPIRSISR